MKTNKNIITVNFPIYNEAKSIKKTINEWVSFFKKNKIKYKIILSEDGSIDGTKKVLSELLKKNKNIINNMSLKKRGYTGAVLSGISLATTYYVLCVDSDGQCNPKDFLNFWKKKHLAERDIIIGNRVKRKDGTFRFISSRLFGLFHKILFFHKLDDPSCPYVLINKNNFNKIKTKLKFTHEAFWWGFVGACIKKNIKIHEININHRKRLIGDTNVYKLNKLPGIIVRNAIGLIKLKVS